MGGGGDGGGGDGDGGSGGDTSLTQVQPVQSQLCSFWSHSHVTSSLAAPMAASQLPKPKQSLPHGGGDGDGGDGGGGGGGDGVRQLAT